MRTVTSTNQYLELTLSGRFDPLVAATHLARARLFDRHVVYERPDRWCYAGGALAEVVLDPDHLVVRWDGHEDVEPVGGHPLAQVGAALRALPMADWRCYGWIAFELSYLARRRHHVPAGTPLLHLIVPRTEVLLRADQVVVRSADHGALRRVLALLADPPVEPVASRAVPAPAPVADHGAGAYKTVVAAAVARIRRGELQKVVLSRPVPVPGPVDLPATYLTGRRHNTPARSFLLDLGGWRALGFSPETVVEVGADGTVSTQPLAGTRARGLGPQRDAQLRAELLTDAKEVYEHAISVQLAHEELLTVCLAGSVVVSDFMSVKARGSVQHLGSRVLGRLADGRSAWDALEALFPAITASGVPKEAAYECILRWEEGPRGLYSGAVLTAASDGSLDAALVLRSLFERDGKAWVRAGAGLVADSDPDRELEETREKLSSVTPHVMTVPVPARR